MMNILGVTLTVGLENIETDRSTDFGMASVSGVAVHNL